MRDVGKRLAALCIWAGALALAAGGGGCKVGPEYQEPDVSRFTEPGWQEASLEGGKGLDEQAQPVEAWWRQFQDPVLVGLVERLSGSNLPLAEARERIVEARARRGIADADRLPQVDLAAAYARAGTGDEGLSFQGPPPGEDVNLYSLGAAAGWELDLWGRVGHLVDAADAQIEAVWADYHAMQVSLTAEMTLAYVEARTVQARLEMVRRNVALQERSLALSDAKYQAGTGTQLQVTQAERLLEHTRSRIPELERVLFAARNRISVLLGRPTDEDLLGEGPPPAVPPLIGIGLPVDLMARRPDLRAAERRYAAAVAQVGAAEAEKYVRLSLSGTLNLQTDDADDLLDKDSLVYFLSPALRFPLFDGGRIRSRVATRESQAEQARLALEQKIVEALSEVENAAAGVVRTQEQSAQLDIARGAAERSVRLADDLYQSGVGDFFQVIDAEEKLLAVEEDLLLARQGALDEVVRLYRALGGGWQVLDAPGAAQSEPDAAPPESRSPES